MNATFLKVTGSTEEMWLCSASCDTADTHVMGSIPSPVAVVLLMKKCSKYTL